MQWLTTQFLSAFLLPPLNFLLLGVVGLALLNRRPITGRKLLTLSIVLLWVFSMPVVGDNLARLLEQGSQLDRKKEKLAQAIVVLSGGGNSLERTRYAAVLHRRTGLPILVTGGNPKASGSAEADRMKQRLQTEFQVPVRWVEPAAMDTIQNAAFSAKILKANRIDTILLVTHGWHMARSKQLFEQQGLSVIPAGAGLHYDTGLTALDFLPSVDGLESSRLFFHEVIGMAWGRVVQNPA